MLFNKSTESRLKSLEDTIIRLEGELKTLSSSRACEGCNLANTTQTIEADITNSKAEYERIDFDINTTAAGINLKWNSDNFEKSLPSGDKLVDFRIVVDGTKETFLNHNKKSGNVILPATASNPQLELRAKVQNSEGIYRYDSVSMLDTVAQGEKSVAIDATIPKTQKELTTTQMNDYLRAEIDKIKLQLKS
tara:strand:+ start:1162 stop:1737 length:576 start_codon:yes stop_codon:yes gene_type:complete